MAWSRLRYLCRRASEGDGALLSRIDSEVDSDFFGRFLPGSLASNVYQRLASMPAGDHQKQCIAIYSRLHINAGQEASSLLKRMSAYLVYLGFIFMVLCWIVPVKLAPSFIDIYENMGASVPWVVSLMFNYWPGLLVAGLLSLALILYSLFYLRRFVRLQNIPARRPLLIPSGIFNQLKLIQSLVLFPITKHIEANAELQALLNRLLDGGTDIEIEIQALCDRQGLQFTESCESYIRKLYALVAVFTVAAIALFIFGLYLPIFQLGEMIV